MGAERSSRGADSKGQIQWLNALYPIAQEWDEFALNAIFISDVVGRRIRNLIDKKEELHRLSGMMLNFPKDLKGFGAGGRTRTDMSLTSPDFESGAYTNFATPASWEKMISRAVRESQPEANHGRKQSGNSLNRILHYGPLA